MKHIKFEWIFFICVLSTTWFSNYMRTRTTLIGYKIGELTNIESKELERLSRLKMKLAKLTSAENLTILAKVETQTNNQIETVASIERAQ